MAKLAIAERAEERVQAHSADEVRQLMDTGSLNLRGVAAALKLLSEDLDSHRDLNLDVYLPDAANMLALLARDVDREADAMGDAEAFLLRLSPKKKGAA